MNKYIFTFSCGQVNAGKCQPIYAENMETARAEMFRQYGDKWCMGYDEKQWEENKERAVRCGYPIETELEPIQVIPSLKQAIDDYLDKLGELMKAAKTLSEHGVSGGYFKAELHVCNNEASWDNVLIALEPKTVEIRKRSTSEYPLQKQFNYNGFNIFALIKERKQDEC